MKHYDNKIYFIINYTLIVFLIAIAVVALMYRCPRIIEFILGKEVPANTNILFIIFMPVIIAYSICNYILNGLMEIKISIATKQLISYAFFLAIFILVVLQKEYFKDNMWGIILLLFFTLYSLATLVELRVIIKKLVLKDKLSTFLNVYVLKFPKDFWRFSLFVHSSTILSFIYDKIDQMFIINYFNIYELGLYYAAIQTAMLIRLAPNLIGSVLLPTFSNLFASNNLSLIQKGYQVVVKYNTLIVVFASLFCVSFSRQILGLFGLLYALHLLD